MTILLTGGAGYIGSHTAVELIKSGYDVVIADNFCNSSPDVISRIESISGVPVRARRADVRNRSDLDALFYACRFDAVIHFAGLKSVSESVSRPLEYYENNVGGTVTLLQAMKAGGVNKIIFSSSATVYGDTAKLPVTEDMPTGNCTNPYGQAKLMVEQLLRDCAAADSSFSAVMLRYFNPVGAHESGLLGESPNGVPANLVPYVAMVAAGKLPALHVYGSDYATKDGTGVRDFIHITDLARGHVAAAAYCMSHTGTEAINLGTGAGHSVLELISAFERVNGVKVPYVIEGRRAGDVAASWASPEKARRLLGWSAEKGLDDMCRDAWRWQTNNPDGFFTD